MPRELKPDMYLTDDETRKLRRATQDWAIADGTKGRTTGPNVWAVVDLALSTGLRVKELAALTVEDLDFNRLSIRVQRAKKRKQTVGYVPMSPRLAEHLRDYLGSRTTGPVVMGQRGAMRIRGWQQAWQRACERAGGVRVLSIHKARHTHATILYRSTHDLRLVQDQLGHESPTTTAIYASVSFEDRAKGLQAMEDALK